MTDAEADQLIEQARPSLRKAIQEVTDQKQYAVMFPLGLIRFPNHETWDISCLIMIEPIFKLIAPMVIHGIPNMAGAQMKPHKVEGPPPQPAKTVGGLGSFLPD